MFNFVRVSLQQKVAGLEIESSKVGKERGISPSNPKLSLENSSHRKQTKRKFAAGIQSRASRLTGKEQPCWEKPTFREERQDGKNHLGKCMQSLGEGAWIAAGSDDLVEGGKKHKKKGVGW